MMAPRDDGRTPLVAGNWKMHKLRAEARRVLRRARRAASTRSTTSTSRSAPPFTCLAAVARRRWAARRRRLAQNAHEAADRRLHGRGLDGDARRRRRDRRAARPLRAAPALRRDRRGAGAKVPAALAAGLEPILCVGETEAEREAGETEALLDAQSTRRCRRRRRAARPVVVAYEPVWAIGTGQTATPEIAQAAHAHIRGAARASASATRPRTAPHPLRRLGEARQRGRAVRPARHRRRPGRRRLPRGRRLRWRSPRPPPARLSRPVALVILDGFGPRAARPRERRRAGRDAACSTTSGRASRTRRWPPRAAPSGCRRARWATPRSAT